MRTVVQFLRTHPDLTPLLLITGVGCTAALTYPLYLLRTHPEIQIDKKNNPYPWQHVQQHQNIKLINATPAFYESRKDFERPKY
ncbi:MAG: NADH-ubiquinone reductase complex 1 MLRQ subunit [Benjaminiella poitrasii]|nr:MAG: NADH-ubiquinone reductase complex 1 MLRQ subunit [Benjaminiella poitrasii]